LIPKVRLEKVRKEHIHSAKIEGPPQIKAIDDKIKKSFGECWI